MPQHTEFLTPSFVDALMANFDEAARVALVVRDQAVPEVKDVQLQPPCSSADSPLILELPLPPPPRRVFKVLKTHEKAPSAALFLYSTPIGLPRNICIPESPLNGRSAFPRTRNSAGYPGSCQNAAAPASKNRSQPSCTNPIRRYSYLQQMSPRDFPPPAAQANCRQQCAGQPPWRKNELRGPSGFTLRGALPRCISRSFCSV